MHLCFFCGGVQSCLICVFFFQSVLQPPCVRGGGALSCAHLLHFKGLLLRCSKKKTRKFFMSFCFCVIVNPSCLQSSQLAINFSKKYFENASCKRLVLALVGFGLASFETRFKKLKNTCTRTQNICRQGLCITKILRDGNSTFLS